MLIALDTQHINKGADPWDRGAGFDLNDDGELALAELEATLVGRYMQLLRHRLEGHRIPVVDGFSGSYSQRNAQADKLGASLYIAGHLNAGGGNYGLVGVDYRAPRGGTSRFVAGHVATRWRQLLALPRVRIQETRPTGARWIRNLHATIGGCVCPALAAEPIFLDGHAHLLAPQRQHRTLDAIAAGLEDAILAAIEAGLIK